MFRIGKVVGMCEEESLGRRDVIRRVELTGSSGRSERPCDSLSGGESADYPQICWSVERE